MVVVADISSDRRCVGKTTELPLSEPDPNSLQLARLIEQDLDSGASSVAEAQKFVAQMGFGPHAADADVQSVDANPGRELSGGAFGLSARAEGENPGPGRA
jgi:hypothetical protein